MTISAPTEKGKTMADKEKLIELLWKYDQMRMMRMSIEECVDHLIANGVTIQNWIPVTAVGGGTAAEDFCGGGR